MSEPLSIPHAICLSAAQELPAEVVKDWFRCVRDQGPKGIAMTLSSTDDTGFPRSVSLVRRQTGETHSYLVPLTRDLTEKEAEKIVVQFEKAQPDLDFEVTAEAPLAPDDPEPAPEIAMDQAAHLALCVAWARKQHDDWMNARLAAGWNYGTSVSLSAKTHPLLRPWTELPDDHKQIDLENPQKLVDLLNSQGYAVVSRDELKAILDLVRKA